MPPYRTETAGRAAAPLCIGQRKSPSPFGPGLCGVGGRGGGDADHRGGVRAERPPRHRVPRKNRSCPDGGNRFINETPRMRAEALRRQLPFQATISRPRPLLTPVRQFGEAASTAETRQRKPAEAGPALTIRRAGQGLRAASVCRVLRKSRGESSCQQSSGGHRSELDWGGQSRLPKGVNART
jgi:hypothetical protein